MFGIHDYFNFLLAILIFQAIPGPGTIAILDATARDGMRCGFAAVTGTLTGDFVYMAAAVAGLAAVMQSLPGFFQALQWLGAAYLCWIGFNLLRSEIKGDGAADVERRPPRKHFIRAFAVAQTNPKAILFFVSFFPLFLSADASAATLAIMMAHVTLLSLLYQGGLVVVGNAAARQLKAIPKARWLATRLGGIALIGLGVKLALRR